MNVFGLKWYLNNYTIIAFVIEIFFAFDIQLVETELTVYLTL